MMEDNRYKEALDNLYALKRAAIAAHRVFLAESNETFSGTDFSFDMLHYYVYLAKENGKIDSNTVKVISKLTQYDCLNMGVLSEGLLSKMANDREWLDLRTTKYVPKTAMLMYVGSRASGDSSVVRISYGTIGEDFLTLAGIDYYRGGQSIREYISYLERVAGPIARL